MSKAWGTQGGHTHPLQGAEKRHSEVKLEIEEEMGTDKNKGCGQNTGHKRQRQKQGRSRMETGLGQYRVQGRQGGSHGLGGGG